MSCCKNNDFCLSDGLCRYTESKLGGSGYYVSGCTDAQYADGTCPQLCNNLPVKDTVFVSQPPKLWKCCGAGPESEQPSCDEPTDENFDAKRPARLETYYQADVGAAITTATDSRTRTHVHDHDHPETGVPTSPPAPTEVVLDTSTSSISPAMAGGIAAATAVGTLLVSLLIIQLHKKRQKQFVRKMPGAATLFDSNAFVRPAMARRGGSMASCDSTVRSESPFGHALSEPWPLKDAEVRDVAVVEQRPKEVCGQTVCELPAHDSRSKLLP